jgi:hypothetical protein
MKTQKKYIADFTSGENYEEELFHASNLKEAKIVAQNYKRHNNIKGVTRVHVCWSN